MDGRRGRGRGRTRAGGPVRDVIVEQTASNAESGPVGPEGQGANQGPRVGLDRDRDLDERLIAAYERGRQARDVAHEVPRGAPDEFRRLYDSFMRLDPPRFDGTGEFAVAEEWLANINAKLVLCRAPEEDSVELAEQQLESRARFWWDSVRRSYAGEEVKIPWEWFEQQFTRRYLSSLQREALRRKFLDLRQEGKSVADYNQEFLTLSRYAPDVQNDVVRYHRQYLDGLDGGISMIVDTPAVTDLQGIMDHAEQVELHSKRKRVQQSERNVRQREDQNRQAVRSGGGPSTARPPPRQIVAPGPPLRQTAAPGYRTEYPPSGAVHATRHTLKEIADAATVRVSYAAVWTIGRERARIQHRGSSKVVGQGDMRGVGRADCHSVVEGSLRLEEAELEDGWPSMRLRHQRSLQTQWDSWRRARTWGHLVLGLM
jgi:hypothetical protein